MRMTCVYWIAHFCEAVSLRCSCWSFYRLSLTPRCQFGGLRPFLIVPVAEFLSMRLSDHLVESSLYMSVSAEMSVESCHSK